MEDIKKIDRQQVEDVVALSPMQEGMLFHYIKNLGSDQYFQQFELALSGMIDLICFRRAWQWVVDTNEMLRTVFSWERVEKPVQIVLKQMEVPIHMLDLSATAENAQSQYIETWKRNDRQEKFNLKTGPLFRVGLCKRAENDYVMLVSSHHIIFDGWSNGVILKEFFSAYEALLCGKTLAPVKKHKFKEYIKWMQQADRGKRDDFWRTYLEGFTTRTELSVDSETSDEIEMVAHYRHQLAQPLQTALARLTGEERVTLGAVLYAAWGIVLQKYTCQKDVVFGTPVSGRSTELPGVEEMVGLFINTLPLRVKTTGRETVAELLHTIQSAVQARQPYESTPLTELKQNHLQSGLFQSIVVVENYPIDRAALQTGLAIRSYAAFEMTNFDLTVSLLPFATMELDVAYNVDRFTESTMERLCGHLVQILTEITARPQGRVADLEMLTAEEREEILDHFNQPWSSVDETLPECFERKAALNPEKVALVQGDKRMTYGELNRAANQLARRLRNQGVEPDQLVGLMVERSFAMLVGIMGILKAGGGYLSIDPTFPDERIQYMLQDSGVRLLLTTEALRNATEFAGEVITLDEDGLFTGDVSNLPPLARSEHLAYVIYTSGSTGKPKGTMVEHGNAMNLLRGMEQAYPVEESDAILLKTAFTFDVSVAELFGWFVGRGRLVLLEPGGEKDPQVILRTIERDKVTHVNFVASMFGLLLTSLTPEGIRALSGVKYIIQAGERLPREMAKQFYDLVQGPRLENLYGPTETTVYMTRYPVSEWDGKRAIPIGKPMDNCLVYIVDPYGHLQPVGVAGEIWIGGACVARGYLGRPELTAEKFIPNFFGNGRIYRSGDLGRWLPDGQIDFIGRMDYQVKIRGYRIELGEVEAQLHSLPGVREAVVLDRSDAQGEKYLCAYVTPSMGVAEGSHATDEPLSMPRLRAELGKVLPEYMIPTRFIILEEMPYLSNGKVDRKALRGMDGGEAFAHEYVAPTTETEERLAKIWAETLGVARVGVYDHFFEMGGHSLKAASAIAKMGREFGREIPLKVIFARPTVQAMAEWLQMSEQGIIAPIESVEERPYYPASTAQRRLWVLHQLNEEDTSYNISGAMQVEGTLDYVRLEEALRHLMARHEALRTSFSMVDGEVVQRIHSDLAVPITYHPAGSVELQGCVKPFELTVAPLFRVEIVSGDTGDQIFVDIHHIIADGVSLEIMMKELTQLYEGESLSPVRVQYKDYAVWQRDFLESEKMQAGAAYWTQRFAGDIPVLNLPTDAPRPAIQSYQGETYTFALHEALTRELRKMAQAQGVTLYMALLAGFTMLLSRYAGQDDIAVGTPVAGRPHADVQDTIGMFVNTVVMRNRPEGRKRFTEFLQEVKTGALEAFEYQDYPFEMLVDSLAIERDLSRTPLFDVMFILQNTQRGVKAAEKQQFRPFAVERGTAKFDLTLEAVEEHGEISCKLEYCTALFAHRTVEQMAGHFRQILAEVVQNPEMYLREFSMLTTEEQQTILVDWNATEQAIPRRTIQELFEAQVERTPEATALIAGERVFTYRRFNEQANQLARALRLKGVQPNEAVGLMVGRSAELILGILGILKAGAAYLPLDPEYPMERVWYMLENSAVRILLTDGKHSVHLAEEIHEENALHPVGDDEAISHRSKGGVEEVDITDHTLFVGDGSNLESSCQPNDLAYILYTSGSTGKPKGVMIEHRAVVNYLHGVVQVVDLTDVRTVACTTTVSFDIFVVESLLPFVLGMRVVMANEEEQRLSHLLHTLLVRYEVDLIQMTPTRMHYFLQDENGGGGFAGLKVILLGGEPLTKALLDGVRAKSGARIYNEYGPTEATVFATYKDVTVDGEITIGKPIANYQVYVVNADLMPLPVNVPGELCIGGQSLARGYCQRPELTEERFIPNPFGRPGEKMYRTGDLVRWRPNGELEYIGRMDYQVKIRGFRIELGEIESQLLRYPAITEAVVVAREDVVGTRYLVGYCTGEGEIDLADVREYLACVLPEYMIPAYLMQLERWPLTPNGKIDRKALPDVAVTAREEQAYVAPENAEEEALAGIWAEVLQVEQVGVLDDFFALGGHSLKAASVVSRVAKVFGVEMPLREVFQMPTVRAMACWIQGRMDGKQSDRLGEIPVQEERAYYPTSSAQKRIFVMQQLTQDTSYNMPAALRMQGPLHHERLENAFARLIERHGTLRTRFTLMNDEPVQIVLPRVKFAMQWSEETVAADMLQDWAIAKMRAFVQPFDLEKAPLLRAEVVKLGEEDHFLFFDMHHIVSDGTSLGILVHEIMQFYHGQSIPEMQVQYKDFAVWQRMMLLQDGMDKQGEFWLNRFAGDIPVLNLPTDEPRPAVQRYEGDVVTFAVDQAMRDRLYAAAIEHHGVTLYMTLLAAYHLLLAKYSGQEEIVIGSPVAGRSHPDLESIIGVFINTLAMRNHSQSDETFAEFLGRVKENTLTAFEHQDYPFEMLVEELHLKRDLSRNPLFDVMLILQNSRSAAWQDHELTLLPWEFTHNVAKFDLTLIAEEREGEIRCALEYSTTLYRRSTIQRMVQHFLHLLDQVSMEPAIRVADIQLLTQEEHQRILYEWNATELPYAQDKTIHQFIAEQAARTPEKPALTCGEETLTYRELNDRANQLALYLRGKGVGAEGIVGIMMPRSLELIIGMLAVLKAGCAYLPIDPAYPAQRVAYMLEDSSTRWVLTQGMVQGDRAAVALEEILSESDHEKIKNTHTARVNLLEYTGNRNENTFNVHDITANCMEPSLLSHESATEWDENNFSTTREAASLAYVIYTSGSTGKPKGVMIEHRAVSNLIAGVSRVIAFEPEQTILSLTTVSFDIFVLETWVPLARGLRVVLANEEEQREPEQLAHALTRHRVDLLQATPSRVQLLLSDERSRSALVNLKTLMIGGEALPLTLLDELRWVTRARIYNMYGPTETTVWSMIKDVTDAHVITLGRPIANTQVYVLDKDLQPLPEGVPGELFIAGAGVAREYLQRPELTAERFVVNPFAQSVLEVGSEETLHQSRMDGNSSIICASRMYRTGDRVQWTVDGEIQFLGRADHQVKIRGYRIELGEIEAQLRYHPQIQDAVVVARTAGEDVLCAYYVLAHHDSTVTVADQHAALTTELRTYLAKSLPEYMIPSFFIALDQLPLTPNGKVDRAALPKVGAGLAQCYTYVAPTDELEETLARIWTEVLHVDRVGIDDHFFEMGGHSLKGTYMVAKMARELGVRVPLRDIFTRPTIRTLAEWIRQKQRVEQVSIPRAEARLHYPASSAQKRMFVVQHLQGEGTSYNLPAAMMIDGMVDIERMERVVHILIQRHEALRTTFVQVGEEIMQVIHADIPCPLHQEMVDEGRLAQRMKEFVRPFDLTQGPLFRAALWKINGVADKSVLLIDMHHIISDGTSLEILIKEWIELYQGNTLSTLPIQYKDFALWQQELLQSEGLQKQEVYWVNRFRESVPVLNLPTDDLRSTISDLQGAVHVFTVERELAEALGRVSKREQATLYMILLAAYQILLAKYAGQEEVVVGTPIAGRTMAETQSIVGMFVNTLAMRSEPTGGKTFTQFLREVRDHALEAFANQDYPFEQLVEQLHLERDLTSNPLFNVMFVLQNFDLTEVQLQDVKMRQLPLENGTAKFDLTLMAVEREDGITFHLEYRRRLFTAETVARMASHYVNILREVVAVPMRTLAQISMISQSEKDQLVFGFNRTEEEAIGRRTVIQCFEEEVRRVPDAVAVICNDNRVTYHELNERANRWARRLRQSGIGPEQRVGVLVERSVEMIVAVLAIWKAGGAYVPLDPEYPNERLQFMVDDSGVQVLLTQSHLMGKVAVTGETLDLNESRLSEPVEWAEIPAFSDGEEVRVNRPAGLTDIPIYSGGEEVGANRSAELTDHHSLSSDEEAWVIRPSHLAYIIYTSGTTGRPKGVMIEHRNISNTLEWRKQEYQLSEADRVLQFFSFAFDGFLTSSFTPLISGASLIILDGEQAKDPFAIRQVIVREQVTHFIAVPSLYGSLLECLMSETMASLRMVTLAGEAVTPNLVQRSKALRPEVELINEYGPTENSVVSTWTRDLEPGQAITIGLPIANTQAYILDRYLQPLPVGVPGEIYVSGAGLARGYVNRPEMTAERFMEHPFRVGERLYRTGDLGRRRPDGQIVFAGRVDEQVKIRGFRIELGEIANQLLKHPVISEAIVLDREDAEGETYLVAYFVADTELSQSELRSALANELPGYMIPSSFVQLESIPLTANGKVDRKALPEVKVHQGLGTAYVAPADALEERLLAIWCEVLGVSGIGMEDHFFELGGHSLKAMTLAAVVLREFQVELPLRTIFQSPTLREMAQRIREAVRMEGYTAIPKADPRAYYPLSSSQKQLFILDQILGPNTSYNTPGYMIVEGDLDRERFTVAVEAIVMRHEVFRTSFTMIDDEPVQVIHPSAPVVVEYRELIADKDGVDWDAVDDEVLQRIIRDFVRPFDLAKAPLLRVGLVRMGQRHFVMFNMHHIISDGTSLGILIQEFVQLYAGKELPELKIQYKDFALWQNQQMEENAMIKQEAYWREQFAGDVPILSLLTDFPREGMAGQDGDLLRFALSRELTDGLIALSASQGVTLFMTLFAIYTILLGKLAGQEDVVVGTPVAGRRHADVHSLIGDFLNTLALRNRPAREKRFTDFLAEVKENTLKAFENQDYPFARLVETLHLPVEPGSNPLFRVMLVLQNQDTPTIQMEGLQWIPYELREMAAKFDFTLYISESPEGLQMALNYRTNLFLRESMVRMRDRWIEIAQTVVDNPEIRIGEVEAVSDEEEERFLMDFNEDLDDDF